MLFRGGQLCLLLRLRSGARLGHIVHGRCASDGRRLHPGVRAVRNINVVDHIAHYICRWWHPLPRRPQRLRQPAGIRQKRLGFGGHLQLFELRNPVGNLPAFRLAQGLQNAGLGHAAELIPDRRLPASRRHVEVQAGCQQIGMRQRLGTAVVGLMHRVEALADAMREEG